MVSFGWVASDQVSILPFSWKTISVGWGGEWAGWRQLPPPTLQVTWETLSSQAGATVFISICLPFGDWDLAFGLSIGWHGCLWPGWRYPARQWPGPGSWRGGEQPGRRSPGGWRSCGGRGPFFINIKIGIWSILTFSEVWGTLGEMSRTLHF